MPKDTLARGARQASFGSMSHISQSKWDAMFESETSETPTPATDPAIDLAPVQEQNETLSNPKK